MKLKPIVLLLAVVVLVGTACGGGGSSGTTVGVELREYEITPNKISAPAGEVTFDITNAGAFVHEMQVVKTAVSVDQLPSDANGEFDASAADATVVKSANDIPAGATVRLVVQLAAGSYVLVCNMPADATEGTPAHFSRHMYAPFVVTKS